MSYKITIENLRQDAPRNRPYGEGTESNPYKISSVENLLYITKADFPRKNKYFLQTNNIDMSNIDSFTPISLYGSTFDGNGYEISNLSIVKDTGNDGIGFFSYIENCDIRNMTLKNMYIDTREFDTDEISIGGLIGKSKDSNISRCSVDVEIDSNLSYSIGGLVGYAGTFSNNDGYQKISKCSANTISNKTGSISNVSIGGLIGRITGKVDVDECVSSGEIHVISGGGFIGRVVTYGSVNTCVNVSNCYSSTSMFGLGEKTSLFIGLHVVSRTGSDVSNIRNCAVYGDGTYSYTFALIGYVHYANNINIEKCFARKDSGEYFIAIDPFDVTGTPVDASGIEFKTGSELKLKDTYTGFDFNDIWTINDGVNYALLQFELETIEQQIEVFEYTFEYPILANTVRYDPESYISYDYMVSTAREASFSASIPKDKLDEDTWRFIDSIIKINEADPSLNDIIIYNYFYYDTDEDSEKLIKTSNEVKEIGDELEDENGISRIISSREKISEWVSTLFCRIYKVLDDSEDLVYAGLINKEKTEFRDNSLKIGLVDMMYLITELSKSYTYETSRENDNVEFEFVVLMEVINTFIRKISDLTNIDKKYLGEIGSAALANSYINNNSLVIEEKQNEISESWYNEIYFGKHFEAEDSQAPDRLWLVCELTMPFKGCINVMNGGEFDVDNFFEKNYDDVVFALDYNPDGVLGVIFRKDYNPTGLYSFGHFDYLVPKIEFGYVNKNYYYEGTTSYYSMKISSTWAFRNSSSEVTFFFPTNDEYEEQLYNEELMARTIFEKLLFYVNNNAVSDSLGMSINEYFEKYFDKIYQMMNGYCAKYLSTDGAILDFYHTDRPFAKSITDIEGNNIYLSDENGFTGFMNYKQLTSTNYNVAIPIYAGKSLSIYEVMKMFSSLCLSKVYTNNLGELYFDGVNFDTFSNEITLDYTKIFKPFSIKSIESNEDLTFFDNIYIGEKELKAAYTRTEKNIKTIYKDLYQYDNKKISFKLLTKDIDEEINYNDKIIVNKDNSKLFTIYVTSVKLVDNGLAYEIEGKSI